jgi:6-pyruvoyl-tetrahydropterin synthase
MKISKTYHFYAGHRNKAAGKKCGRIHGHTYDVTCVFEFTNLDNGITMLFSDR